MEVNLESVSPDSPKVGDTITVTVRVINYGGATEIVPLELEADGTVVDTETITVPSEDSNKGQLSFIPVDAGEVLLTVGERSARISVSATKEAGGTVEVTDATATPAPEGVSPAASGGSDSEAKQGSRDFSKIGTGPNVKIQANRSVVKATEDALLDIFWDNSIINEDTYILEVYVDVPTGLFIYAEQGAISCAAGICKGLFQIPPGSSRNLPLLIKASEPGDKFLHLNGRYFPENDPGQWNPISLSTPIKVEAPSPEPGNPEPTSPKDSGVLGNPMTPTPPPTATATQTPLPPECPPHCWPPPTWSWVVLAAILAIVIVAAVAFKAIPRTVKAARPKIDFK